MAAEPRPLFPEVTIGLISWRAPATLAATLRSYRDAGVLDLFGAARIYFNEISTADRALAADYGFAADGAARNTGIFGAVSALAARVDTPLLLSLENDCPLVVDRDGLIGMLRGVLSDMATGDVPVFIMRSRRDPGDAFDRARRYQRKFRAVWPIGTDRPTGIALPPLPVRLYEDWRRPSLRGCALYAEEDPSLRHPAVIRRSANGHWLTSASVLNWTNNAILVRTAFLRDVVLARVASHPAASSLNGHQDIEAAMKRDHWWRRQGVAVGQCEPGAFTHRRLDR